MSRRTIQMLDLLCVVQNHNSGIDTVQSHVDSPEFERWPVAWRDEAKRELREWTAKRDKALAKITTLVASFSEAELLTIRRRYEPETLAMQLKKIGINVRWWFLRSQLPGHVVYYEHRHHKGYGGIFQADEFHVVLRPLNGDCVPLKGTDDTHVPHKAVKDIAADYKQDRHRNWWHEFG